MKIDIYLNDYFNKYNNPIKSTDSYQQLDFSTIKKIYNYDDLFILRGEPTIYPYLYQVLDLFKDSKNYILTTEATQIESLINYRQQIPYISISYDGYMNDEIRGHRGLTLNIISLLKHLSETSTTTRFCYTINPSNLEWIQIDIKILQKFVSTYSNMKAPYFSIYQKSVIFGEPNFVWTPLSKEVIDQLNASGLLTQKNLTYLRSWFNKAEYSCTSPQEEIVVMPDSTVRLCQSLRSSEVLGNLQTQQLSDILTSSQQIRKDAENCPFKYQCWLAYHHKDNLTK